MKPFSNIKVNNYNNNHIDPDGRSAWASLCGTAAHGAQSFTTVMNVSSAFSQTFGAFGGVMQFVSSSASVFAGIRGIITTADLVQSSFPGRELVQKIGELVSNLKDFISQTPKRNIRGSFSEKRDFRRYSREVNRRLANSNNLADINSLNMQRQTIRAMKNGSTIYELRKRTNNMPVSRQVDRAPSRTYVDPDKNRRNGRIIIEYSTGSSNVSLAGSVSAINLFQSRQITLSDDENSVYDDGPVWDEVDAQQYVDARNAMRSDGVRQTADPYIKEIKGSQISLSTDFCRTITTPGPNWGDQDCNSWESFIRAQDSQYYIDEEGKWSSPEIRDKGKKQ